MSLFCACSVEDLGVVDPFEPSGSGPGWRSRSAETRTRGPSRPERTRASGARANPSLGSRANPSLPTDRTRSLPHRPDPSTHRAERTRASASRSLRCGTVRPGAGAPGLGPPATGPSTRRADPAPRARGRRPEPRRRANPSVQVSFATVRLCAALGRGCPDPNRPATGLTTSTLYYRESGPARSRVRRRGADSPPAPVGSGPGGRAWDGPTTIPEPRSSTEHSLLSALRFPISFPSSITRP